MENAEALAPSAGITESQSPDEAVLLGLKKFKLDFNGEVFSFADDQPRVEEINLQSHFMEPGTGTTYLRENLALKLFQARSPHSSATRLGAELAPCLSRPLHPPAFSEHVAYGTKGSGWQAQKIGVPASTAVHIRLHQNGEFYGLYSMIEQVGSGSLRRVVQSSALTFSPLDVN
jgi:hypothetical protein